MRRATSHRDPSRPAQMAELQKLLREAEDAARASSAAAAGRRRRCSVLALRRAFRTARRLHLPPADAVSGRSSLLCRRSRPWRQPEAARAHQGQPISCCCSAGASRRFRARPIHSSTFPAPQQTLVHVHPDPDELGRVYRPHLAINASPTAFSAALEGLEPPADIPWSEGNEAAHGDYLAWSDPAAIRIPARCRWAR